MDNVVDALYMATAVLLLIVALTVSISSFTTLKTQVDEVVKTEQTSEAIKDETGNYINYITSSTDDVRTVTAETLISTIRRVPKENFVVYIYSPTVILNLNTEEQEFLLTESDITQEYKQKNGSTLPLITNQKAIKISLARKNGQHINQVLTKRFYELLQGRKFKEYLGIYQFKTAEGVSSANKETYRVITFVES